MREMTRSVPAVLIPLTAGALFVYFAMRLAFSFNEVFSFVLGLFALWAPLAIVVYQSLEGELEDSLPRVTFSLIASYTLTTLLYFLLAAVHLNLLFYCIQIALLIAGVLV